MAERRTKRERKSTDFFNPIDSPKSEARTVVTQGKGVKLGDIPNVTFKLDKLKGSAELLENLHQILFKSKGKAHSRKRDIKAFSGFAFDIETKDTELERLEARLSKWTTPQLNSLLDLLDLPRGSGEDGVKEKKVDRLKAFFLDPAVVSEKDLGAQAAQKKEKKEKSKVAKARKEAVAKKSNAKKEAKSPTGKAKAVKSPAEEGGSGRKRKAPTSEEKPAKKAKKALEKKTSQKSAPIAKPWPPAKDVQADVEFCFQSGLDRGEEMTMGKIYAELAKKYGMTTEEIKTKKAQIKTIVKEYEVQLEAAQGEPVPEGGAKGDVLPEGPQAMDIDDAKEPEMEETPAVVDPATTEGDENQDAEAAKADAGVVEEPEGTKDIQTMAKEPISEAPSTEAQVLDGAKVSAVDSLTLSKPESTAQSLPEVKSAAEKPAPSQPQPAQILPPVSEPKPLLDPTPPAAPISLPEPKPLSNLDTLPEPKSLAEAEPRPLSQPQVIPVQQKSGAVVPPAATGLPLISEQGGTNGTAPVLQQAKPVTTEGTTNDDAVFDSLEDL